jgi:hypothetical protein
MVQRYAGAGFVALIVAAGLCACRGGAAWG